MIVEFDVYLTIINTENDGSGIGIILIYHDSVGRIYHRDFGYLIENTEKSVVELQAVRIALASIIASQRHNKTVLITDDKTLVERIVTTVASVDSASHVVELKRWCGFYPNLSIVADSGDDKHLVRARQLAMTALKTQSAYDSSTMAGD